MSDDITKLCADSLRAFTQTNHGITLKSSHAHELVAAFFGYQSRAALLADNKCPLSNLRQAEFIVFNPPIPFIDLRRQNLEGLSPDLPQSYSLAEAVYSPLIAEKWILEKVQPTFRDMAIFLADKYAQRLTWFKQPAHVREEVNIEAVDDGMVLTVSRFYQENIPKSFISGVNEKKIDTVSQISRIAANLGYGNPKTTRNININTKLEVHV